MKFLTTLTVAATVALTACASVPLKQQASTAHQSLRSVINIADQTELALCQPNPVKVNSCTSASAVLAGLTDQRHQKFSAAMVEVFNMDAKVGVAIANWKAGDPVPQDVKTLLADAQAALNVAVDIGYGPLTAKVQDVVTRAQAIVTALGSK